MARQRLGVEVGVLAHAEERSARAKVLRWWSSIEVVQAVVQEKQHQDARSQGRDRESRSSPPWHHHGAGRQVAFER